MHGVDRVVKIAAEAVELPHHQRIALPQRFKASGKPRPVVAPARDEAFINMSRAESSGGTRGSGEERPFASPRFESRRLSTLSCSQFASHLLSHKRSIM